MEIVKRWRHIKSQRERGLLGPGKDCYLHQIVESFRDKVFFFSRYNASSFSLSHTRVRTYLAGIIFQTV